MDYLTCKLYRDDIDNHPRGTGLALTNIDTRVVYTVRIATGKRPAMVESDRGKPVSI